METGRSQQVCMLQVGKKSSERGCQRKITINKINNEIEQTKRRTEGEKSKREQRLPRSRINI